MVAYHARDEIYRSCRDAHSVTMAILVTKYKVMACNRSYKEARDGHFWLFSDALLSRVKQLKPEELARDSPGIGLLPGHFVTAGGSPGPGPRLSRRRAPYYQLPPVPGRVAHGGDPTGCRQGSVSSSRIPLTTRHIRSRRIAWRPLRRRSLVLPKYCSRPSRSRRGGRLPWRSEPVVLALRPWVVCPSRVINWSRPPVLLSPLAR